MLSRLREHLGSAGLIVAIVALVAALAGGAVAATGGSDGGKATASAKKTKKGPRGPKGLKGDTGPAGVQGPAGVNGKDGAGGSSGAAGKSVSLVNEAPIDCAEGGFTYEVEGSGVESEVCNGEQGEQGIQGPDGSPWVAGEAPSGVTLKGTWMVPPATASGTGEVFYAPISTGVPIPVGTGLIVFEAPKTVPPACPEGSASEPKPGLPGVLCVFVDEKTNLTEFTNGLSKLKSTQGGAMIGIGSEAAGPVSAYGTWALKTP